jgi:hypothetical protein
VQDMLRITPSAYVFIYSRQGVDVISAHAVWLANTKSIGTDRLCSLRLGDFYDQFFQCFIGDDRIEGLELKPEGLRYFADENNVKNVILMQASTG